MLTATLTPEIPEDRRGPCLRCIKAVDRSEYEVARFTSGGGLRALFIGCACDGRGVREIYGFNHDRMLPAASVAKLAWIVAAVRAHHKGSLNLCTQLTASELGITAHRDVLAVLPGETTLPWVCFLGLALVTSANPAFEHLTHVPGLATKVAELGLGVDLPTGFADKDLDGPIRDNRMTAHAAAVLLVELARVATGPLLPLLAGLTNGSRCTRLVCDAEDRKDLPVSFSAPNKTGSLAGVRNDVALFRHGTSALAVSALTDCQDYVIEVDNQLANLGTALVKNRWTYH